MRAGAGSCCERADYEAALKVLVSTVVTNKSGLPPVVYQEWVTAMGGLLGGLGGLSSCRTEAMSL